jgi:hypothetical protein
VEKQSREKILKGEREHKMTMEYLVRLAQMHETFRRPELEALAVLHNVDLEILEYADEVRREPFLIYVLFAYGVMVGMG